MPGNDNLVLKNVKNISVKRGLGFIDHVSVGEATVHAKLKHDNIIKLHDWFVAPRDGFPVRDQLTTSGCNP